MAKVTLTNSGTAFTGDRTGLRILCQAVDDESGAMQVELTAGTASKVEWQGRLSNEFGWVTITDTSENGGPASLSTSTDLIMTGLPVLPQIRTRLVGASSATYTIYIME